MWSVVHFFADDSVEAVPKHWFKDKKCAWPIKSSNINRLIEKRVIPNPLEYQYLSARLLANNIGTLTEARSKAKKGTVTSELSSTDDTPTFKETRVKKKLSFPTIPIYNNESDESAADDEDKDPSFKQPTDKNDFTSSILNNDLFEFAEDISSFEIINNNESLFRTEEKHDLHDNYSEIDLSSGEQMQDSITPAASSAKRGLFSTLKNEASSSKKFKNDNKPVEDEDDELRKQTIKLLTGIKYEIKSLAYSVECLQNITKTIVEKLSAAKEATTTQCTDENATFYDDVWPIECESDLNQQEECLKDVTKRNAMIKQLARLSDKNISGTVRRIMQHVFSDTFLKQYSYLGFKGKNIFSKFKSCQLIFDTIRSIKLFENTPDKDIEQSIKSWLAQASNRLSRKNGKITSSSTSQ
eukprot:XP_016657009.1 PREDICTED: uncharacterized protein LOC107882717 [Acyrthosiphon pisum]